MSALALAPCSDDEFNGFTNSQREAYKQARCLSVARRWRGLGDHIIIKSEAARFLNLAAAHASAKRRHKEIESGIPREYQGRLIRTLGENNYFHDSYWYVLVWDDSSNAPRNELAASTAGAGGWIPERSGMSHLTPRRQALYERWQRLVDHASAWLKRQQDKEDAKIYGINYLQLRELRNVYRWQSTYDRYGRTHSAAVNGCLALLKVKKFRSKFRQELAAQIRDWLNMPPSKRQYPNPLSAGQLSCILNYETQLDRATFRYGDC